MLIPQFSIRTLLALTAVAAMIAWVLHQATAGALWAKSTAASVAFVAVLFAMYAALFVASWVAGRLFGIIVPEGEPVVSPFATSQSGEAGSPFGDPATGNPFAKDGVEQETSRPSGESHHDESHS